MTLEELKRLAEKAATRGPQAEPWPYRDPEAFAWVELHPDSDDAKLVYACSPERILAMIRVIEAAIEWRTTLDDREVETFDAAIAALFPTPHVVTR